MTIKRLYPYLLSGLIIILMVLSFLIGREEGKGQTKNPGIVFSCSPEVLAALKIPPPQTALAVEESTEETGAGLPATPTVLSESAEAPKGKFLGSKNGTKYYTPDCSGAKRIKPENYVWFSDEEDAKIQGYTPANC